MIEQLATATDDYDLTSPANVLVHTIAGDDPRAVQALVLVGDGAKDAAAVAGDWELIILIGDQVLEPSPAIVEASAAARKAFRTAVFPAPPGAEITIRLTSPHAADSDVTVTAYLFAEAAGSGGDLATDTHLLKAALANRRDHNIAEGIDTIYDDDGTTPLLTMGLTEADGVVTRAPVVEE